MTGWKLVFLSVAVAALMLQDTASAWPAHRHCPKGVPYYFCLFNPCYYTWCPRFPGAHCEADYCGGCNARFYVGKTEVTDHCYRDFCQPEDGARIECDGVCGVDPISGPYCDPSCDINNGGCSDDQVCVPGPTVCSTASCRRSVDCIHKRFICTQKPETGPCEAHIKSYFYNANTQQCETFFYGGCEGNENRFSSAKECAKTCDGVTDPCASIRCASGSRCKLNKETGLAFCEKSCEYENGGCAEDEICKLKQEELLCREPCPTVIECLSRDEVCKQKPDPGPCRAAITSLFFNSTSGQCEKFIYGGCGGNENRFSLLEDCLETCGVTEPTENPCNLIDCASGMVCIVNDKTGAGECVEAPTINPCSYLLCQPSRMCQVNEDTGAAECVFQLSI